eukprot:GHVQ01000933.1.p1 GENE.GHVQ01000933.1~~GHVQ01000933.1.p1  ORF type:complete len:279 (+),score=20.57 GHVQ01000933.1:631-1467(+)
MIKFTKHGPRICVCASRASHETEYAIRLWDLVDNRYMRYFPLAAQVCRGCGLSLHAAGDLMSVCCVDSRVRVYNLSQDTPIATIMSFTPHPVAAFDNRGLVLVCFLGRAKLHFFDARKLTQPEFQTIDLHEHVTKETDERVTSIVFSPDDKHLLLGTNYQRLVSLNALNGKKVCEYKFEGVVVQPGSSCGFPSYTPDGKYVLCGGLDRAIHIWNTVTCARVMTLKGHPGMPMFVKCNPRKALVASACLHTVLWQPSLTPAPHPSHTLIPASPCSPRRS